MELEDVHSELHALRKLYGLLQINGDALQNASSEILDEKARLLLKNLLDDATERVFETHSKIIAAAQLGVSNAPCSTQPEQPKDMPKLQPLVSPSAISKASPSVIQNSAFRHNDEVSPAKPTPPKIVPEWSKPSISATEPENRKKRCRVCEQSSMKQLNSSKEASFSNKKSQNPNKDGSHQNQRHEQSCHFHQANGHVEGLAASKEKATKIVKSIEKPRQKRICEIRRVRSTVRPTSTLPTGAVKSGAGYNLIKEIQKKAEEADYISKQVADAIKRIDLRLSALQLTAENVDPLKEKSAAQHGLCEMVNSIPGAVSVSSIMQTKEGVVTKTELSQIAESGLDKNDLPSQLVSQRIRKPEDVILVQWAPSQSCEPVLSGNNLPSQITSQKGGKSREFKLPDQTVSQICKPFLKSGDSLNQVTSQRGEKSKSTTTLLENMPSQALKRIAEGHDSPSQKASQVPGPNVMAIVDKIESLSRLTSQGDHVASQTAKYVQGFRVSPSQNDEIPKGTPSSQINKENHDQNRTVQKEAIRKVVRSRPSIPPQSLGSTEFVGPNRKTQAVNGGHKLSRTRTTETILREKNMPRQTIMRPTLLDHKPSQITVSPKLYKDQTDRERSGIHKSTHVGPRNNFLPRHPESEGTSSSPRSSSSSWTSQQTRTSSESSEGYPLPGRTRAHGHVGPTSRRIGRVARQDSLEGQSFSHGMRSQHWGVGPTKTYRSGNRVNREKEIGRLGRLKNKLAVIFHHHHHHHYHHNDDDDSDQKEVGHATTLWKHLQKIFHRTSKSEAYGERAVENFGRSAVSNVPGQHQHGRFHALVEGALRHVRNSKKSKPSKRGIERLGHGQHGHKKVVKKLHWWQRFRSHRGVKLPNKARVRVGFMSKRPQLGAPKMR